MLNFAAYAGTGKKKQYVTLSKYFRTQADPKPYRAGTNRPLDG